MSESKRASAPFMSESKSASAPFMSELPPSHSQLQLPHCRPYRLLDNLELEVDGNINHLIPLYCHGQTCSLRSSPGGKASKRLRQRRYAMRLQISNAMPRTATTPITINAIFTGRPHHTSSIDPSHPPGADFLPSPLYSFGGNSAARVRSEEPMISNTPPRTRTIFITIDIFPSSNIAQKVRPTLQCLQVPQLLI